LLERGLKQRTAQTMGEFSLKREWLA